MNIDGLVAVVTGGASGLGKACAKLLSNNGAKVFIADTNAELGRQAAVACGATFKRTDVTNESEVVALFDQIEKKGEPARILVNCAGTAPQLALLRDGEPHSLEVFEHILKVNVTGTFLPISRFVERLTTIGCEDDEKGVIINTSSITAFDGQAGHLAYAATKGAIASMTLPLARELAHHAIRAMTIAPGLFDTPMMKDISDRERADLGSQAPHPGRLGHANEFAELVCHIIANPMFNGETVRLDAALRMTAR
ncbi:MAG: SDR family NAD(P)-dependent oxidoreductase [Sphingomonadaceae bacterium]